MGRGRGWGGVGRGRQGGAELGGAGGEIIRNGGY